MPTKDAEKIEQAAVYIDGKPIKGIQEIKPQHIRIERSFAYRLAKLIRTEILVFMVKHRRKGR